MTEDDEPLIHSHLTDRLPDEHPLANESVDCDRCRALLHACNNECMQTWFETAAGNFCTECYTLKPAMFGHWGGLPNGVETKLHR